MKILPVILLACSLATPSFADDAGTKTTAASTNKPPPLLTLPASAATITAPFALTNGYIGQPEQTDVEAGGKATFTFSVTNAGDYVFHAIVSAPGEDANSFYLNVDKQPEDPMMIWDIDPTEGFEERAVSWRGNGDASGDEFAPKRFHLTAGAHKLIVVGREPALLKSISIREAK